MNSVVSLNGQCWSRIGRAAAGLGFSNFFLEREPLLSRNTGDPTVGGLWGEKGKRSTRNRLRMDSDFSEFIQTPRGRISLYLDFIPILSVLSMFRLFEAVRGRLIGPKT